jgi:hypothetical protein
MKNKITCLLVLAIAITTAQAQDPQKKMRVIQRGPHLMMRQHSALSEEQQKKLKALQEDYRKNLMDLHKKDDITVKEWRAKMEELQKKHHEDLQSFITPEQKSRIGRMRLQRNHIADINAKTRMNRLNMQLSPNHGLNEKLYRLHRVMPGQMKTLREHQLLNMQKRRPELRSLMEKRIRTMKPIPMYEQKRRIQQMKMYRLHKPGKLS